MLPSDCVQTKHGRQVLPIPVRAAPMVVAMHNAMLQEVGFKKLYGWGRILEKKKILLHSPKFFKRADMPAHH
jgi:hypothetical protein